MSYSNDSRQHAELKKEKEKWKKEKQVFRLEKRIRYDEKLPNRNINSKPREELKNFSQSSLHLHNLSYITVENIYVLSPGR